MVGGIPRFIVGHQDLQQGSQFCKALFDARDIHHLVVGRVGHEGWGGQFFQLEPFHQLDESHQGGNGLGAVTGGPASGVFGTFRHELPVSAHEQPHDLITPRSCRQAGEFVARAEIRGKQHKGL